MTHLKIYTTRPLHRQVLAVLVINELEKTCYSVVLPVAGKNHEEEAKAWMTEGVRQPWPITEAFFGGATEDLLNQGYRGRGA